MSKRGALGGGVDGAEGGEEMNAEDFGEIVEVDMEEEKRDVGESLGRGGEKRGEFVVTDDGEFTVQEEEAGDVEDLSVSRVKPKMSHVKRVDCNHSASPGKGAGSADGRTGRTELNAEGNGKCERVRGAMTVGLKHCQVAVKRCGQNHVQS